MIKPNSSLGLVTLASWIVLLGACSDGSPTSAAPVDAIEELQAVRVRVSTELALLRISGPARVHRTIKSGTQPVVYASRLASLNTGPSESRTIVKHFRKADGKTSSLAWYFKKGSELPTLIYAFENGQIQSVVGLAYARHGNGYLRRKVRVTTFDSTGTPKGQVDVGSEPSRVATAGAPAREIVAGIHKIAADILSLALPRQLHAEEGACASEYLSYLAASAKLAAAIAALEVAGASCIGTGVTCPVAGTALIAFLDLLDKWNLALDALIACTDAAKRAAEDDNSPYGSGASDDPFADPSDDFGGDDDDLKTVQEFIDDSIAAGTYTCSASGDVCTYYAE